MHGALRHSAVFDEVVYPTAGYSYWTTGDYRLNPEHPPALKLWTSAAWLGRGLRTEATPGWVETDQWRFGRAMLYRSGPSAGSLLGTSRAMTALLSAALAWLVFAVASHVGAAWGVRGEVAGLTALTVFAFDPLVVAHAGLATTDLGAAAFYFAAVCALPSALLGGTPSKAEGDSQSRDGEGTPQPLQGDSPREAGRRVEAACRVAVAGTFLGLALASKFSALPLVLVVAAAVALVRGGGLRAAGVLAFGMAVLALTYRGENLPLYARGLAMLGHHGAVGHPAYALGEYFSSGRWWFFPVAWAMKTPLPILALAAAGAITLAASVRRARLWAGLLLLAPGILAGAALASSLNLGVRHLLPAVPFLAVGAGLAAAWAWDSAPRPRLARGAIVGLLTWLVAGTLWVHPDEMAYSNELFGGPSSTWRHLADSSVDWGQDLPALAEEVARHPLRRLYLGYFGTADPSAHGLRYTWIPSFGMADRRFDDGPDPDGKEWIAISVTNLQDVYAARHDAHAWLRRRPMTAFPGHSIALYDVTGDAAAHRKLGETALAFGDAEAALPALRRALELAPADGVARLSLVRALAALGLTAEAASLCRERAGFLETRGAAEVCVSIP